MCICNGIVQEALCLKMESLVYFGEYMVLTHVAVHIDKNTKVLVKEFF